ncbi:MAG: hypothetical protein M1831_003562 [Alyxoria varia]|nr:MAG: hypothetical protein M1831_003562 [Alyxoria varia]
MDHKELGFPEYWDNRYSEPSADPSHPSKHEWFRTFDKLRQFFDKQLPDPSSQPRILHLGCGDSTLTADLAGLQYQNQISVDFSEVVIKYMQSKHPSFDWRVDDVRKLSLGDATIDIAIDKGTLDAMLYGSQWDPPIDVQENVKKYVNEVARVLKPRGRWIYITFRQPHFVKPQISRESVWDLNVEQLQDDPGSFQYFAYILTKHGPGEEPLKREGLTLLNEVPDGTNQYDLDVIAVHGLNGHPRDSWTFKNGRTKVYSLQDFLPKALPGARIFTYGYDSRPFFSQSTGDISAYGRALLEELSLARESGVHASRRIVFICHSMGGLVCKKALVIANDKRDQFQWILDNTKAIFFFGTPHEGSDVADTALVASPIYRLLDMAQLEFVSNQGKPVRKDLIKELSAKSKALDELCEQFVERTKDLKHVVSFYELNKYRGFIVVPKRSASIGITNEKVLPLPRDHFNVCRIENESDSAFRRIRTDCRDIVGSEHTVDTGNEYCKQ